MSCLKASLSTNAIQKSFSQAAGHYDEHSGFHQRFARQMIEESSAFHSQTKSILDIGCGTGYLSALAKENFAGAQVAGLDFSSGMIVQAQAKHQGIDFVLADARQMPFSDASFDLIFSNFAFQWLPDLAEGFREARRVLTDNGGMYVNLFGVKTCEELFHSLEQTGFQGDDLNRFAAGSEIIEQLGQAGFGNSQVQPEIIKLPFKDLWQLLSWLKALGANKLSPTTFFGPKMLQQANAYCQNNFSDGENILISFDVIKIQAT